MKKKVYSVIVIVLGFLMFSCSTIQQDIEVYNLPEEQSLEIQGIEEQVVLLEAKSFLNKKSVSQAGDQISPRQKPRRRGGGGKIQRGQRGIRGAVRCRQAFPVRPVRLRRCGSQLRRGPGGQSLWRRFWRRLWRLRRFW